jgi:hypothetical protein
MVKLTKVLVLVIGLLMIQLFAGASEYEFGSKVLAQDNDIGKALYRLPFADIMYWDIGPNPGIYDEGDILYLTFVPGSPVVRVNTVRITPFEYYAPGSKVMATDLDINMPLTGFMFGHAIVFLDLYGSSMPATFDLKDPAYFHIFGPNIVTNDVRLTNITYRAPGTKVIDFDLDQAKPVVTLQPLPAAAPGTLIAYFDVNGNGVYDYPDDLYLLYPTGGFPLDPHVRVNSLRLSGPAY